MNEYNEDKERRFSYYLNKIILLSSKAYYKKNMNISDKECNNEDIDLLLYGNPAVNNSFETIQNIELKLELETYENCLSQMEKSVLFLLFNEQLSQNEAAKILDVYTKTISKIKIRAINKLRNSMNGDDKNEK